MMGKMNLPNKLTVFRIFMVPLYVFFIYANVSGKYLILLAIFLIASITDMLDGMIARKNNLVTDFGKFMDPLADKLLVISVLVCFVEIYIVPAWVVIIIIARELAISIMRAIAASDGKVIAAGNSGKLKTVFQMIAIIFLLFGMYLNNGIVIMTGKTLIYISLILTIYSGYEYFSKNLYLFKDR